MPQVGAGPSCHIPWCTLWRNPDPAPTLDFCLPLQGSSCHRSPRRLRQACLADIRRRAAEAAATLSTTQTDYENTSALAARLLSSMEAATQRRREAQEMKRARLAARTDLLLQRLVSSRLPPRGRSAAYV